jgi:hypothetical protein
MALKFSLVQPPWPAFTETQVKFLEEMFPARCMGPLESVEAHLRYAGKVDLIAQMREHVVGSPQSIIFTDEEEDALDEEAIAIANARRQEQQQEGE